MLNKIYNKISKYQYYNVRNPLMVSRGVNFPIKTGSPLCDLTPQMMNLKPPPSHLFAPSSPKNLITMTRDLT